MGRRGRLAVVFFACAALASAAAAAAQRSVPVYAVTVTGSLSTSAFVPPAEKDGCRHDAASYVRTLAFRSTRPVRAVLRKGALRAAVPVSATFTASGTRDHRSECPDGTSSNLHVDWGPTRTLDLRPLTLQLAGGRVWLDGETDDISGACFRADTPPNPLPLAGAYAEVPAGRLAAARGALTARAEEDEEAQSDTCLLVRSVRWRITFRRTG